MEDVLSRFIDEHNLGEVLKLKDIVEQATENAYKQGQKNTIDECIKALKKKVYAYDENEDSGCINWKDVKEELNKLKL